MTSPSRRGACPEVLHPMETGDGLLARLPTLQQPLALEALRGLCAAARAHGNGVVEVTRRGNVQVRGLRAETVSGFADAVRALGIDLAASPVQVGALSGRDAGEALDVRPLAAAIRARLASAPFRNELGPKVSVIVDGGGAQHLDGLDADLRLRAVPGRAGVRLHLGIAGDGQGGCALGTLGLEHAADAVVRLAEVLAKHGPNARARDVLRTEGPGPFTSSLGEWLAPAPAPPPRPRAEPIGSHALRGGGLAVGLGLAFGQSDADALEALADAAARAGASAFAPAAGHCLLAIGVEPAAALELRGAAEHCGFIARSDDPRRHISACAGSPACAAARMPTRTLGAALARAAAPLLDGSIRIHLSGCAKGCAHPGPAAITLVGVGSVSALVVAGTAAAEPIASFEHASLERRLERLNGSVAAARRPGEDSASVLRRFGARGVAHALGGRNAP